MDTTVTALTPAFWAQVRQEFEASDAGFLCVAPTFSAEWNRQLWNKQTSRAALLGLAERYVETLPPGDGLEVDGHLFLFWRRFFEGEDYKARRRLDRLAFLDWVVGADTTTVQQTHE